MSRERALDIWRSVRTTFILFLVLMPVILVFNAFIGPEVEGNWAEQLPKALGMLVFAGVLAEGGRRLINHLAGATICRWEGRQ